jgi:hypothetical protein
MTVRRTIVARILLIDGVLLITLAFVHLLATPIIQTWLTRELTPEKLKQVTPPQFLDNVVVGMLLIPFGVSTLYSAIGVRAGQTWARAVAITNAFSVTVMPLLVILVMGPGYFSTLASVMAAASITSIGLSMFIPLLWLGSTRES